MSYTELNDNAKKLVDALRSRKYNQGFGRLTSITPTGDRDCCLGVACKVAMENGVVLESLLGEAHCREYKGEGDKQWERMELPQTVKRWLGFKTVTGCYSLANSLAVDNDNHMPFDKIADIIENSPGKNSLFE